MEVYNKASLNFVLVDVFPGYMRSQSLLLGAITHIFAR